MPTGRPDDQPNRQPNRQPNHSFSLGDVLRVATAALLAGLALGYLALNFDDDTFEILARIFASVGLVTLVMTIFAAQWRHRIEAFDRRLGRIEELLSRDTYWRTYTDVMSDLGGMDGEDSTDSGRLPPRR